MSKCAAYDETLMLHVRRNGEEKVVPFKELKDGDSVVDKSGKAVFTCDGDAHLSGDASYDGWLVYGREAQDYFFPEDFGAKLIRGE